MNIFASRTTKYRCRLYKLISHHNDFMWKLISIDGERLPINLPENREGWFSDGAYFLKFFESDLNGD